MLFNTLDYAVFFAVVFVLSWLIVQRRWLPLLPWSALAGYAFTHPSPSAIAVGAAGLVVSLPLCSLMERGRENQAQRVILASLLANALGLGLLTYRDHHVDPISFGLRTLGVPTHDHPLSLGLFCALGLAALYFVLRAKKVRLLFLLGASYVFYAHWDWRFLPLIWASSTADWLLGNAIGKTEDPRKRRLWLAGTLIVNLGVLAVFKYFNFGLDTAKSLLQALGFEPLEIQLRIALPVGISFFTFESMSYVIDIYRRQYQPQKSYFEYLSFVAFFPHLVAGPIIRPRDLLPQLASPPRFSAEAGSEGVFLITVGLVKKVAIGDYLAINLIDRVFDAPMQYSGLECYTAVVAYAVQIYCDFSGYTDIAIGSALLLGVRFPLNFNAPYKARNIVDFWRRWHISLSTWLRDYLYIPLGGNRKGPARTYVNLMLTMLLGGLWHGASWSFVVWGGLHGAALSATRAYLAYKSKRRAARGPPAGGQQWVRQGVAILLTFQLVCAGWIFFRADSFENAWLIYSRIFSWTSYHPNLHPRVIAVLLLGLVSHLAPERFYAGCRQRFVTMPAIAQAAALLIAALGVREMASAQAVPFVYFQF